MITKEFTLLEVVEIKLKNGRYLACFDINELPDSIAFDIDKTWEGKVHFDSNEVDELNENRYIIY